MSNIMDWTCKGRTYLAARMDTFGIPPAAAIGGGLALDLAAVALIATQHDWLAAPAFIAGMSLALLGRTNADARWQDISQTFDLMMLGGIPFAFALADPSCALAACFLLFSLVTTVSASLFALHLHKLNASDRLVGTIGVLAACVLPHRFSLIAYLIGVAAFIAAGARVSFALTRSSV